MCGREDTKLLLADNFILQCGQHKGKTVKIYAILHTVCISIYQHMSLCAFENCGWSSLSLKNVFWHCWTQELCCTNYKYNTERVWHYQSVFKFFWWKWKVSLSWRCVPTSRIFIIESSLEIHPGLIGNLHNCDVEIWSMHCTKPRNLFSIM